jgi:hypothetical protein
MALSENGSVSCRSPLEEGTIGFTTFDNRVDGAGHFASDCGIRLAAQMCVVPVLGDVALELVPEAIGALQDGNLSSHPQSAAQSGVAVF